jgi:hypothetical protein
MLMSKLPDEFAALEAKWGEWIIDDEAARGRLRITKSPLELAEFHQDIQPRLAHLIETIDKHPIDALPQDIKNLWWLVSSYIGVAVALEMYGAVENIPGGYLIKNYEFIASANALEVLR